MPFTQKIFELSALTLADILFILPVAQIPVSVIELKKILQKLFAKDIGKISIKT